MSASSSLAGGARGYRMFRGGAICAAAVGLLASALIDLPPLGRADLLAGALAASYAPELLIGAAIALVVCWAGFEPVAGAEIDAAWWLALFPALGPAASLLAAPDLPDQERARPPEANRA